MTTTHPAAQPVGDPPNTKPPKTPLRHQPHSCTVACAGGNDCDCDSSHAHRWHICRNWNCKCHEEHRGNVSERAWKE